MKDLTRQTAFVYLGFIPVFLGIFIFCSFWVYHYVDLEDDRIDIEEEEEEEEVVLGFRRQGTERGMQTLPILIGAEEDQTFPWSTLNQYRAPMTSEKLESVERSHSLK